LVTTDVSGVVKEVFIKEGQAVKAGDPLLALDPRQFEIALESAKAHEAQALLSVQSMKADYQRMLSDIEAWKSQVDLDKRNFDRDAELVRHGNTSKQTYDQTRLTLEGDERKLGSLEQMAATQLAKLVGNPNIEPTDHPEYRVARAAVDEAQRQLDHSVVRAPFDGIVTEVDGLQPGTLLVSGLSSFSTTSAVGLVSTHDVWVEAQLKETDLTHVKAGDKVRVHIDAYSSRDWDGVVDSVAPSTGAAFSVLPAENASGNWVKVVQRVSVRIKLDVEKSGNPQLRAGMSTSVRIDTGHRRWYRMLFGADK
jgi:membrane fusion protein (multidrug efflux system)